MPRADDTYGARICGTCESAPPSLAQRVGGGGTHLGHNPGPTGVIEQPHRRLAAGSVASGRIGAVGGGAISRRDRDGGHGDIITVGGGVGVEEAGADPGEARDELAAEAVDDGRVVGGVRGSGGAEKARQ